MIMHNMKIIVILNENIKYENTYENISNLIARAMLNDNNLRKLHEENKYKLYTFCSLYPFEKDGIYKKDKMYAFDMRYLNMNFGLKIKQLLGIIKDPKFKVVSTNIETHKLGKISKLVSLTPSICTVGKNNYKLNGDINLVKSRLIAGAEKKYSDITGDKVSCDFIKSIVQTNIKPIKLPYKNTNLLGYKFEIEVKDDEVSQNLAQILYATGILEKNSQGYGFCKAY